MIRKAVGAIVYKESKYLLVGKVKVMNLPNGPVDVPLAWYIPGGEIKDNDESNLEAIKRELKEETGSQKFRIIRELEDKLCFRFPSDIREKTGFERQETTVFFVEYIGTFDDLVPNDEEIDRVEFVAKEELFQRIFVQETKDYLKQALEELELN
ncbi:MAG: NUDIX domain-containing protein [Candidatus Thorarchaeota archaeon]